MTAFSDLLRQAMAKRGMTRPAIVNATGACSTLVKHWMDGTAYPDHGTVVALVELLDWPALAERSLADRTGPCEACGGPAFSSRGHHPPRFCGHGCRRRASDRRKHARVLSQERKILRLRLEEHTDAVAAFCRRRSPEGCTDHACELRPVSPIPLIPLAQLRRNAA